MTRFLDYNGLKTFKDYLDIHYNKIIKDIVGINEDEDKLSYSTDENIDNGVFSDEEVGNGIIKLKRLSYYHKKLKDNIKTDVLTSGSDLNTAILDIVADSLVLNTDSDSEEVKSEIYVNVENIVDEKLKWNTVFPQ